MTGFRFDHLHLRSADPESAARFYVEALGATHQGSSLVHDARRVVIDLGGVKLFIEQVPPATPSTPQPPFLGLEHLAVAVDDLDQAATTLRQHGVTFVKEPASVRPGLRIAFIQGPDGVLIEVLQRAAT
jgi:catechol 2,3-dioxygenase-like lactoylglutathione lyase family enzyme